MSTAVTTTDGDGRRTVVVTGGSRGIGRAICGAFVAEGDRVVALDIEPPQNAEDDDPQRWSFITCDVSSKPAVDRAFAEISTRYGHTDVLVCNAGILRRQSFLEISEDDWDMVLDVNLKSNFLCGQAAARQMVDSGTPGAIVNIASIAAIMGTETGATYSASKGGVAALTKSMALSLAKFGIRVNSVAPGSVATSMVQTTLQDPTAMARVLSRTPLQRLASPGEIADVVTYLASAKSSYITAQTIFVDGGRTALNYTVASDA